MAWTDEQGRRDSGRPRSRFHYGSVHPPRPNGAARAQLRAEAERTRAEQTAMNALLEQILGPHAPKLAVDGIRGSSTNGVQAILGQVAQNLGLPQQGTSAELIRALQEKLADPATQQHLTAQNRAAVLGVVVDLAQRRQGRGFEAGWEQTPAGTPTLATPAAGTPSVAPGTPSELGPAEPTVRTDERAPSVLGSAEPSVRTEDRPVTALGPAEPSVATPAPRRWVPV